MSIENITPREMELRAANSDLVYQFRELQKAYLALKREAQSWQESSNEMRKLALQNADQRDARLEEIAELRRLLHPIQDREVELIKRANKATAELAALKAQKPVRWLYEAGTPGGYSLELAMERKKPPYTDPECWIETPLYLAAGAQPISEVTPAQLFDIYCKDKGAGDWHRPEHNYYAGFRRAMAIAKGEAT